MECGICGKTGFRNHPELIKHIQDDHMGFFIRFVNWWGGPHKKGGNR